MENTNSIDLEEFIRVVQPGNVYNDQVIVMEIFGEDTTKFSKDVLPLRVEALSCILVCRGEMCITMDYIPYTLTQHMVLERPNMYVVNDCKISHDFHGYNLILSREVLNHLFEETITLPKEFAASRRHKPVQKLDSQDFTMLVDVIRRLLMNVHRITHFFQKGIILNEVRNLIMELSNIYMRQLSSEVRKVEISHHEELAMRFAQLLVNNAKEWNEVSQYSTELCVTPVYLSRSVKSLSGKTALDWINAARIGEAKNLLRKPKNTAQDVAELLNFSDPSAFGKFFKKHTGMSPVEYKRVLREKE